MSVSLATLLADVVGEGSSVDATSGPDGATEYRIRGQAFAAVDASGQGAEFRLDPAVAAAARRTPDATGSTRGVGWVRFAPVVLDEHGVDRAVAWFESAARLARGH